MASDLESDKDMVIEDDFTPVMSRRSRKNERKTLVGRSLIKGCPLVAQLPE